jgi:hypothetical protein
MLYIANIELVISYYENGNEIEIINHIVEAESEQDVRDKIYIYYDNKDIEYYISHTVKFNYINEIIE